MNRSPSRKAAGSMPPDARRRFAVTSAEASSGSLRVGSDEWRERYLGGQSGAGIRIAVIDTGWARESHDHRVLPGCGFVESAEDRRIHQNDDYDDRSGHGTYCSRVIMELAPAASIIPIRVFGSSLETSCAAVEVGLDEAMRRGARVINLSLGTRLREHAASLYRACARASADGAIIVAAAHAKFGGFPARFDNVIGVNGGVLNERFAYRYDSTAIVECRANERHILPALRGLGTFTTSGSSNAAPVITGLTALIVQDSPRTSITEVRAWLAAHAQPPDK